MFVLGGAAAEDALVSGNSNRAAVSCEEKHPTAILRQAQSGPIHNPFGGARNNSTAVNDFFRDVTPKIGQGAFSASLRF